MFKYCLYQLGFFFVRHWPPRLCYKLAAFISDVQYFFSVHDRGAIQNNLKRIVPSGQDIPRLTRETFRNFGRYLIEFLRMEQMADACFIEENVRIENIEYIDKVLREGKGGILVTAHIGNWELGAAFLGVLGYPVMAVALPHKERQVNDIFNSQREFKGLTVVPTSAAIRRGMEQLKENKLLALVTDRDFGQHGTLMDFFGCKALFPKGAAMFSWKTGAPVIPVFLLRHADGTFDFSFHEPIYPPDKDTAQEESKIVEDIMRRYITVIEAQIRAYPDQWLVFREFCVK
jgi:KDO2-lipid IV(A) lauroyltransferase